MLQSFHTMHRQFLGALLGGMLALLVYQGYSLVAPHMGSVWNMVFTPAAITEERRDQRQDRIVEMAKEQLRREGVR